MPSAREWWSFGASVYLPSLLYGIGAGAVTPVIVLTARDLGASLATSSVLLAVMGAGKILGDIPAGALADRLGERMAMFVAGALTIGALFLCIHAESILALALGVGLLGAGSAVWGLARHAYLTQVMPFHLRGRALSTLGGTQRIGLFLGPFLGAAAIGPLGLRGAYWVHVVATALATLALFLVPDAPRSGRHGNAHEAGRGTVNVVRDHWPVLRTLGVGALMISAVRSSRQVIVPLWADQLQLSPATTSIVFGVSGAVDMLLFYPSGLAMDRLGRRSMVVASMVGLGVAHVVLPLSTGAIGLMAVASLMGLGNGLSAGANMTIGADASPAANRATFLGAWRLLSDVGAGLGPLAVGALTFATALGPAAIVMGGIAGFCAWNMAHWLPPGRPQADSGA